ncbi:hypothetical protein [Hymenobacter sp. BT491]|uniref:hypothetical protein n=1 Tax=Hymenobacter sp. BT491 TaxID=2766779 RepID=UPI001653527F|nr:hypothetical protein [Hymenobacter sp. BT491]MBC6989177.1 hypothetical protein [Hymenobacter sp. BT491]
MNTEYSILVNSTDSYDDCWGPFFTLFKAYWPDCQQKIYLNTEHKDFAFPGLDIRPTQASLRTGQAELTWSECFLNAFDTIESDYVLYLQEDYFLKGFAQPAKIQELVNLMQAHDITYVGLSDPGNLGPFTPSFHPDLWTVGQKDAYRISLQASLFNKEKMRRYVRKHENPWQFEYFGNKRAHRVKDSFYTLNRDLYPHNDLFPYDATGIVSKQWDKKVVLELFEKHHIDIDYAQRGFFTPTTQKPKRKPITVENVLSRLKSLI